MSESISFYYSYLFRGIDKQISFNAKLILQFCHSFCHIAKKLYKDRINIYFDIIFQSYLIINFLFPVNGICNGKKCHHSAVCVNYNCVCKPGFIGDGYHHCQSKCFTYLVLNQHWTRLHKECQSGFFAQVLPQLKF